MGESGTAQFTTFGYDGYGRLVSRKAPQQSSATTYSYYADDTVQTITDARGATQSFGYNGRHLPTAITYGAHGGAAATANVSINYDALGNRTRMDDGPGFVDYVYNQQSQLEVESRYFDDLNRSYTTSYEYNIGGQLKSITDPFGSKVEYGRDRMGRVTGATGTGYGGVSQLATGLKYRAWGALKELTNGDVSEKANFALGYDSRLRLTRFDGGGRVTEHDYYADSRVGAARDFTYSNFNRSYGYDHVGRLSSAGAGTSPQWQQNPYSFTYGYDVWGNTTARSGTHWSQRADFTASYTNNRNTQMSYDVEGNVTQVGGASQGYDAAGRLVRHDEPYGASGIVTTTHQYDGDGRRVRWEAGASLDYHFVRSSVLGGRVVAELTSGTASQGNPNKGYVYVNGEELAYQQYFSGGSTAVVWVSRNPVTGSNYERYRMVIDGEMREFVQDEKVVDPVGANVSLSDPYPASPPAPPEQPPVYGAVPNFGVGCYVDGIESECSRALGLVNSGAATVSSIHAPGGLGGLIGSGIMPYYETERREVRDPGYDMRRTTVTTASLRFRVADSFMRTDSEAGATASEPQQPVPTPGPAPERPGEKLSDCVKQILSNYLSPKVLDSIRIHSGLPTIVGMTEYVSGPKGAVTWGSDVYFGEGQYDPYSAIGISNIGHEGAHVEQFARLGKSKFSIQYADSYKNNIVGGMSGKDAYLKNRLEVEPYALGERIRMDLQAVYKGKDPCKP